MIVQTIKDEFYHTIGERLDRPRTSFVEVLRWMNDACSIARGLAGDLWARELVPTVAGQGLYQFPAGAQRLIRVAQGPRTLQEVSRAELDAYDFGWDSRVGRTDCYTVDGFLHNQFQLYRIPETASGGLTDMSANYGIVGRWVREGVDVDLSGDYGFSIGNATMGIVNPDYGRLGVVDFQIDDALVLWYVPKATVMTGTESDIPLREPWAWIPLWYALWKFYGSESENHNPFLEGTYKELFYDDLLDMQNATERPLPRKRVSMGGGPATRDSMYTRRNPFPDQMTDPNGNPVNLIW